MMSQRPSALRRAIRERGLTRREIASIGISPRTIDRLVRGECVARRDTITKLARALDLSIEATSGILMQTVLAARQRGAR